MTSAVLEPVASEAPELGTRGVSPVVEWLAVGGSTLVLLPLAWWLRAYSGLDAAELAVGFVMFHAAHFINDPHFSVTYLLFYPEARARVLDAATSRMQRARYVFAGVIVPLLLVAWAAGAIALRSAQALGVMIQLMFLLVGWHYAKQGFGVLAVLSARRGVRWSARERSILLAHCFCAWAFAWANPVSAAGRFEEKGVVYWAPAHPTWLELATGSVLALSTLALFGTLLAKHTREGRLPFTPLFGFLVTIWLWTIFTRLDPLLRYVIPALHSLQYLYFVWLLKRNQALAQEGPPTFGPPVSTRLFALGLSALALGWLLFRGAPAVLDAAWISAPALDDTTRDLGSTPFFAAFFVVVNIHHYFMDNVIWRRDNPDMRHLQA